MEETAADHFDPKIFGVFREIVLDMIARGERASWDAAESA